MNLRELRKQKGLTQAQLAKLARCDQAAIVSYELGRYKPSMITSYYLAQALDVTMEELVQIIDGGNLK